MNALTELRDQYAAALATTGLKVYDHVPEILQAPCVVIEPATDWLTTGDGAPFEAYKASWTLTVVADIGDNDLTTTALDGHVMDVIEALVVESVTGPIEFTYNTAQYLAAVATVSDLIRTT